MSRESEMWLNTQVKMDGIQLNHGENALVQTGIREVGRRRYNWEP